MASKMSQNFLGIGSEVEVTSEEEGLKGSWYKATIKEASITVKKHHYWVNYDYSLKKAKPCKFLHESVHVSKIRPLPPLLLTNCRHKLYPNDVVDALRKGGWWKGVIVKVIGDNDEDDHGGGGGGDGGGFSVLYLVAFEYPKEEILLFRHELRLHFDWVDGKWVRPTMVHEVGDSSKEFNKESTDSEGSRSSKKLKRENAVQAPPVFTPCEFNSISTKESYEKADCFSVSTEKGDINDCSKDNNGKSKQSTKTGRRKKKPPQRFIPSQLGDKSTGDGELMHEDGILQEAASEAELSDDWDNSFPDNQKEPYGEPFSVSEMEDGSHELETAINKQVVAGTSSTSEVSYSWPFVKRSGVWKTVDSMDVFTRMPQTPHFSPLKEYEENLREKLAIFMMMEFAYEDDRISKLSPDDLKNTRIASEILGSLKELEFNGFNVMDLKYKLHESELQVKLEEVKSKIRNCEAEKAEAENEMREPVEQMKSLKEKLESAKMTKSLKEQELAKLQHAKGIVSGKIQSLELEFQKVTASF